jgi:ubiquitin-protein ligase
MSECDESVELNDGWDDDDNHTPADDHNKQSEQCAQENDHQTRTRLKSIKLSLFNVVMLSGRIGRNGAQVGKTGGAADPSKTTESETKGADDDGDDDDDDHVDDYDDDFGFDDDMIVDSEPGAAASSPAAASKYGKWKSGTGYGSYGCRRFNMRTALHMKRSSDIVLSVEIDQLTASISSCPCELHGLVVDLIAESSLIPTMIQVLHVDSMLEIERFHSSLIATLRLVQLLTSIEDLSIVTYIESNGTTLIHALQRLLHHAQAASNMVTHGHDLGIITDIINIATVSLAACPSPTLDDATVVEKEEQDKGPSITDQYVKWMKDHAFAMCECSLIPASSSAASRSTHAPPNLIRRLANELSSLSTSLPVTYDSAVIVRMSSQDLRHGRICVFPADGTPYANGAFLFTVDFGSDYPASPPKMHLLTTGGGTVRFNPNLYNCGKVCLSLLNTWTGTASERWQHHSSSFLQILVSIQALIFIPTPYFNEPGYESSMGTDRGTQASNSYNSDLHPHTVRWAMIDQLQHPDPLFADVIRAHFYWKRHVIMKQVNDLWHVPDAMSQQLDALMQQLQPPNIRPPTDEQV